MGVICHSIVSRVNTQTVLSRQATSDGRFTGGASAPDPIDVFQLFPKHYIVGSLCVL
jgi:hypothetical protein